MNIFNLTASLTLDKSNFNKNIKEAKNETTNFAEKTLNSIKVISANAWVELGQKVFQVGQKIAQTTLQLIDYADKYADLSQKYDISTQSLQEFEYVSSQTGATLETVLSTMTMMYNRAKENDEVFGKLGVSVRDVNGNMKTMDTLFWEVKEALDKVDNSGDRSALMLEAFGRNAMSLGEFLRKDTTELKSMAQEAHELGIILDTETTDKAGEFNDKLDELKLQGQSAFASLVLGAEDAEQKIDGFVNNLTDSIEGIIPAVETVGGKLGKALIKGMLTLIRRNFFNKVLQSVGYGWLWKNDKVENFLNEVGSTQNGLLGYGEDSSNAPISDTDIMDTNNYSVTERKSSTVEVKLTASGTGAIDEENAKLIAKHLVPIIDKELGGI